jgi:hypothetical protein
MMLDDELQAWREEWTAQPAADPDLARRVRRQSRLMRLMLLADVLVTALFGGGTVWLAATSRQADTAVLAGATWVFLAAAWGFGMWNRRGAWRPVALTSSAYLEISIRRCRSAIRAVIFGMVLFLVEVLFCLAWIYNRTGSASFLYSTAMLAVGVATVVFFVGCLVYRARKRGELAWLLQLEKSMR